MPTSENQPSASGFRPAAVDPVTVRAAADRLPAGLRDVAPAEGTPDAAWGTELTGLTINSREVQPGDLYVGVPGAHHHGARFAAAAEQAGAAAVLTDAAGVQYTGSLGIPVFTASEVRRLVGPLAAAVFNSMPEDSPRPVLLGITGTNGKTTTSYFVNSLQQALGRSTGLIGTIEILAGGESIPSVLTTPESPQVHGLLALMRERGLDAATMEVSSHALTYRRVDGVRYDVAGFTNLTQDHLDLHGSMEAYFAAKAALFQPDRSRRAVVTVDDQWGVRMAEQAGVPVLTLATDGAGRNADWNVTEVAPRGLGHSFVLRGPGSEKLRVSTALPGGFNISNAALATVMVLASGVPAADVQEALDAHDPFTVEVPGRMQLIGEKPAAIVDFAHNPDALTRTLEAVRGPGSDSRVIVVFGATGERDQTKRPLMGAIAARLADVVVITDDDPHGEDAAGIRADVLRGAEAARSAEDLACLIEEVAPRAAAIDRAVELARPQDTVLVAGRGHEVWQEVMGENLALDDRVELRRALTRYGFSALSSDGVES